MQNGRVQVIAPGRILYSLVSPVVALAMSCAGLDTGTPKPGHKRTSIVIASLAALSKRRPTKLGRPNDQRIVIQPRAFRSRSKFAIGLSRSAPWAAAPSGYCRDYPSCHTPCGPLILEQNARRARPTAAPIDNACRSPQSRSIETIVLMSLCRFSSQVERFGCGELHLGR